MGMSKEKIKELFEVILGILCIFLLLAFFCIPIGFLYLAILFLEYMEPIIGSTFASILATVAFVILFVIFGSIIGRPKGSINGNAGQDSG